MLDQFPVGKFCFSTVILVRLSFEWGNDVYRHPRFGRLRLQNSTFDLALISKWHTSVVNMYLPFRFIYDNASPLHKLRTRQPNRTEVERSLSNWSQQNTWERMTESCIETHIKQSPLLHKKDPKSKGWEEKIMPCSASAVKKAHKNLAWAICPVSCPTRRLKNRCCQRCCQCCCCCWWWCCRRRLRHSHEAGYV